MPLWWLCVHYYSIHTIMHETCNHLESWHLKFQACNACIHEVERLMLYWVTGISIYTCFSNSYIIVCIDKQVSHVARRLYGGCTPWKGHEHKIENEATRLRWEYVLINVHYQITKAVYHLTESILECVEFVKHYRRRTLRILFLIVTWYELADTLIAAAVYRMFTIIQLHYKKYVEVTNVKCQQ